MRVSVFQGPGLVEGGGLIELARNLLARAARNSIIGRPRHHQIVVSRDGRQRQVSAS